MPSIEAIPKRSCGLLMHISSLPSVGGIGDLGQAARTFSDQLAEAGQSWWQILPLNPPACGNSPYSSYSAFAGNPLLIDLEQLVHEGLLPRQELPALPRTSQVDYGRVRSTKLPLLAAAFQRFASRPSHKLREGFEQFCMCEKGWLDDYPLFMALRDSLRRLWIQWPKDLALRAASWRMAGRELSGEVDYHRFLQFIFARQFAALRLYAGRRGVRLIGDMPMFVAHDSADVWSHRELFELDRSGRPIAVAGVPPDLFCRTGQLWGNPLYNWRAMARSGFRWWGQRIRQLLRDVDLVRLDHFRGLEGYWRVPGKARTARAGRWVKAPGRECLVEVRRQLGALPLVAEDLGDITPEVEALRDEFALPGMKVLQFAFDGSPANPHALHHHVRNCIVYTGTHDNDTTVGWWRSLDASGRAKVRKYLPAVAREPAGVMIEAAMASVASLAIIPMQDVLRQGSQARMNTPGQALGNWQWRLRPTEWTVASRRRLRELAAKYARAT